MTIISYDYQETIVVALWLCRAPAVPRARRGLAGGAAGWPGGGQLWLRDIDFSDGVDALRPVLKSALLYQMGSTPVGKTIHLSTHAFRFVRCDRYHLPTKHVCDSDGIDPDQNMKSSKHVCSYRIDPVERRIGRTVTSHEFKVRDVKVRVPKPAVMACLGLRRPLN